MPLSPEAKSLIRRNLEAFSQGQRPPRLVIEGLTKKQLEAVNAQQLAEGLLLGIDEVVCVGRHTYHSRIMRDGYNVEHVVDQIESALGVESEAIANESMTAVGNPKDRADRLGNLVHDEPSLECTKSRPNPEVFSVVPKGGRIKPKK